MKKVAVLLKSLDDTKRERDFDLDTVNLCIAIIERRFMGDLNREDMEVRRCVDDLKKYFGIEP